MCIIRKIGLNYCEHFFGRKPKESIAFEGGKLNFLLRIYTSAVCTKPLWELFEFTLDPSYLLERKKMLGNRAVLSCVPGASNFLPSELYQTRGNQLWAPCTRGYRGDQSHVRQPLESSPLVQ